MSADANIKHNQHKSEIAQPSKDYSEIYTAGYLFAQRPLYERGKYVGDRYGRTAPEMEHKLNERECEIMNLLSLRREYNRYVKPRGIRSALMNPLVPFGIGTIIFSLIYSAMKARDTKLMTRMLDWRVRAQIFSVCAVSGGLFLDKYKEHTWITHQATERSMSINTSDLRSTATALVNVLDDIRAS